MYRTRRALFRRRRLLSRRRYMRTSRFKRKYYNKRKLATRGYVQKALAPRPYKVNYVYSTDASYSNATNNLVVNDLTLDIRQGIKQIDRIGHNILLHGIYVNLWFKNNSIINPFEIRVFVIAVKHSDGVADHLFKANENTSTESYSSGVGEVPFLVCHKQFSTKKQHILWDYKFRVKPNVIQSNGSHTRTIAKLMKINKKFTFNSDSASADVLNDSRIYLCYYGHDLNVGCGSGVETFQHTLRAKVFWSNIG